MAKNKAKPNDEKRVIDVYPVQYFPVEFTGGTCLEAYAFRKYSDGSYAVFLQEGDRWGGFSHEFPIPPEMFGGTFETFMENYKTVVKAKIAAMNDEVMEDGGLKAFLGFAERKDHPEVTMVELPEMAVIGKNALCWGVREQPVKKAGGPDDRDVVDHLWESFHADFSQVAAVAMKDPDGTYTGYWGVMSSERPDRNFAPWHSHYKTGQYLAGVEVNKDAEAPAGWTKWLLPARTYAVADVQADTYEETYYTYINTIIPEMGLKLNGAICDYIDPPTGKTKLFFPVAVLR